MLDPYGQAWQSGSGLAAYSPYTPGRAAVNKYRLYGPLQPANLITSSL